jgi:hypothetical protein
MKYSYINLIHIFFTGPLLIYIGLFKPEFQWIYWLLFLTGLYVMIRFSIWLAQVKELANHHAWYLMHILLVVPLLLYVGWMKKETPSTIFSLLLALGIAAFGYHLVRLIEKNVSE